MTYEIHLYVGSVHITEKLIHRYPVGEKHAFLFYLKELENSEYEPDKAADMIAKFGYDNIEFSRAGKLDPEKLRSEEKEEYYQNALKTGSTFILYKDPILT